MSFESFFFFIVALYTLLDIIVVLWHLTRDFCECIKKNNQEILNWGVSMFELGNTFIEIFNMNIHNK